MEKQQLLDLESQPLPSAQQDTSAAALQSRVRRARLLHLGLTALLVSLFFLVSPPADEPSTLSTSLSKPTYDWSHLSYERLCPGVSPISSDEFTARRAKLASLLSASSPGGGGWSAYVTEPGPNTLYYVNLTESDWYTSERPWLVAISPQGGEQGGSALSVLTPAFEKSRSQRLPFALTAEEYEAVHWVTWQEEENPYAILINHLDGLRKEAGFGEGEWGVQLEENVRTFVGTGLSQAGAQLASSQPAVGFASLEVREQRMRKTEAELDIQRCVAKVTLQALREVRTKLYLGMTELDGQSLIKSALSGGGLTQLSSIVLFGANAALPHASAGAEKRLERGEFALFDVGGHLMGYESDFTRTMLPDEEPERDPNKGRWREAVWRKIVGGCGYQKEDEVATPKREWPSARAEKVWKTVNEAQKAALRSLVNKNAPGGVVYAADVDKAARETIAAEGWKNFFTHRVGHGIGLQVHEAPYLNSGNTEQPLQPGETFSNEPGIYIESQDDTEGNGIGVRLEDMVEKTESGWELISGSPLAVSPWEW